MEFSDNQTFNCVRRVGSASPLVSEPESDAVVEVEFCVTDDRYPLVSIPERLDCRTRVEQIVPRGDDTYAIFHCFSGATAAEVRALLEFLWRADRGGP